MIGIGAEHLTDDTFEVSDERKMEIMQEYIEELRKACLDTFERLTDNDCQQVLSAAFADRLYDVAMKHRTEQKDMMIVSGETVVTCGNCGEEYALNYTVQKTAELRLCLDCVEGIEKDLYRA